MSERLYYDEPFLTAFEAHVSDIREVSRSHGQALWQIALDRTAFYPSSGGQPHDTGVLTATAPSGATLAVPIVAVEEDTTGEIWHTTSKPLLAGTAVRAEIDWSRRRDHMQQHSGQHLLSAVFYRESGVLTVSFHLGETASSIDLAVESLSARDLERVEDIANQIIAEDRPVTIRKVAREEAEALMAAGKLRKLPEREGSIRLIDIENLDLNACGGTHVRATGQIGGLLLRGTERVKQGVRVEFVCGLRAIATARRDLTILDGTAQALSVGHGQITEAVERLLAENKAAYKERQKLAEELVNYHAARLVVEAPIETGLRVVRRVFDDHDGSYTKLLASRLAATAPQTCALLASTKQEPAKVVMASSRDLEMDCGSALRNALAAYGARGGGSPDMAQGQIPSSQLDALFSTLEAGFRKATA